MNMTHNEAFEKAVFDAIQKVGSWDEMRRLAEQGNAEMQYVLAVDHLIKDNVHEGAPWLKKAAEQGHMLAQFSLGNYYDESVVLEKDKDKAKYWWGKAAEQGHKEAKEKLQRQYVLSNLDESRKRIAQYSASQCCISAFRGGTYGLTSGGAVAFTGNPKDKQLAPDISNLQGVVALLRYSNVLLIGVKTDGIAKVIFGYNGDFRKITGQIETWRNIVAIGLGGNCVIGLRTDGTVAAAEYTRSIFDRDLLKCKSTLESWRNIISIAGTSSYVLGVKSDGMIVATGSSYDFDMKILYNWRDIISVSATLSHVVGLKTDGTVFSVGPRGGEYDHGQCNTSSWRNIAAIYIESGCTVGLIMDGTVVAAGRLRGDTKNLQYHVAGWRDIVSIYLFNNVIVGLKSDGTVVAASSSNDANQYYTADWRDIVAISTGGGHVVGLKADGTVVAVGDNKFGQCNTESWRDVGPTHT